jgi:hypothetical protein
MDAAPATHIATVASEMMRIRRLSSAEIASSGIPSAVSS